MSDDLLIYMAQHARTRASLLASLIALYGEVEGLNWEQTALKLRIDMVSLAELALCRRPREDHFREDVTEIAEHIGIDDGILMRFVRRAESFEVMQAAQSSSDQFLLAARDRDEEDTGMPDE